MQGAGCYYIFCKNTCVCEVNKLERRFYLVDAQVLPEVFLKVVKAKELLASRLCSAPVSSRNVAITVMTSRPFSESKMQSLYL